MAINSKPIQTWCVILQTFTKKSRKELVAELVQGFGLDEKEAGDAVENFPIVLVDSLNLNQAKSVKERLEMYGAEIEITNHDIIKKQCYRIEWPEQPSLVYFEKKVEMPPQASVKPSFASGGAAASASIPLAGVPRNLPLPKPPVPIASGPATSVTPESKPKKSWFLFGKKESKLDAAVRPVSKPLPKSLPVTSKPKAPDSNYQPQPATDLNQSEWQKRTKEIQDRLEKMGAVVPEQNVQPSSHLVEQIGQSTPLPPVRSRPAPPPVRMPSKEKVSAPAEKKEVENPELIRKAIAKNELDKTISSATPALAPIPPIESKKPPENLAHQSNELLSKIQKLEDELAAKKQNLDQKHAELERRNQEVEQKHRQVEEVQKLGETFSEKVGQLEKALSEKEKHLNEKHSELEKKSEKETVLAEGVAHLEAQLNTKNSEIEARKQEILQLNNQYEESLKAKDHELEIIQGRMQEIAQKFQVLEQGVYEKGEALARKDEELQAKEQKIRDLQMRAAEFDKKVQEAQSLEKDKEQQIVGLQAREKEMQKKTESMDKTLTEMGESLRQRDDSLRQRDEVLVALERRVQDLAEKTGNFETIKAAHSKLQEELEDVSGKYNRLVEEHRRLRSKNERKTATLTREMGEWVRKVDHLRQGLQKFNQNIVRPDLSDESESDSTTPPSA